MNDLKNEIVALQNYYSRIFKGVNRCVKISILFKSLKEFDRLQMTEGKDKDALDVVLEVLCDNQLNVAKMVMETCEIAMEDPTLRSHLLGHAKELNPQYTAYSMLPEAVKDLLKD